MQQENKTILYAVRHGETEWNRLGIQQGHLNSPLTETGIQQAKALAQGLSRKEIEIIISSDLGRALQTAQIITTILQVKLIPEPCLRERNLGIMQGMTIDEFSTRYPDEYTRYQAKNPDYVIPGGESIRQHHKRCVCYCNQLVEKFRGKTILLVAHGGVISRLFYYTLHIGLYEKRRFSLFNAAINRFTIDADAQWCLDIWGDISHLKGMNTLDDF